MYLDIEIYAPSMFAHVTPLLQHWFSDLELTVAVAVEGITPRIDKAP
jgi:hypothetical protein